MKENKELTIEIIYKAYNLLKQAYNTSIVQVVELATELDCKKIELMEFINNNINLFSLLEYHGLPLRINEVYLHAYDNVDTDEYVEHRKNHAFVVRPLGLNEDVYAFALGENYHLRTNTKEKFEQLRKMGLIERRTTSYGENIDSILVSDWKERFKEIGWTYEIVKMAMYWYEDKRKQS